MVTAYQYRVIPVTAASSKPLFDSRSRYGGRVGHANVSVGRCRAEGNEYYVRTPASDAHGGTQRLLRGARPGRKAQKEAVKEVRDAGNERIAFSRSGNVDRSASRRHHRNSSRGASRISGRRMATRRRKWRQRCLAHEYDVRVYGGVLRAGLTGALYCNA